MSLWLLTILLSLPVLVTGFIFLSLKIKTQNLRFLLAFSAAYLFSISVTHLLPECYEGSNTKSIGLFILVGFFIQIFLEYFSTGIEHGHTHAHSHSCEKHLPLGMIIGLYLHSLLEGLPIYQSGIIETHSQAVLSTQESLVFGITIHNIPIAIAFVTLLLEHKTSKLKTVLLLLGFALMAPLGCLISYVLNSVGVQNYDGFLKLSFAVVIGIFLHISTAIMFETGENHKYNLAKIMSMIAGVFLAALIS
ncbi:MAG: ZIP family metal transporter [Bacteroidetes bacterium]|jgi:zinc and cadmium transporter|nr:ZIP family metal transporter [Bacteroidota bacterium]